MPVFGLVKQNAAGVSNGTSVVCTLASNPTSGNMLILCAGAQATAGVSAVSGGGVTTWTSAKNSRVNRAAEIWYGVTDGSSAAVTVTYGGKGSNWANLSEWTGILASGTIVHTTGSNSGSSQNPSTGNAVTSNAVVLLIACERYASSASGVLSAGPTNSFTTLTAPCPNVQPAYREVSATGTYNTDWTFSSSSDTWDAVIVAFNPAVTTGIKTINGLLKGSVKTVNSLAIASVKTWNGLA